MQVQSFSSEPPRWPAQSQGVQAYRATPGGGGAREPKRPLRGPLAGMCVKNRIANPSRPDFIGLLTVFKSVDPKSAPKISPAEFYQDCGRIVEF